MGCCDDPTEPEKISRADFVRIQQQYGDLLRDLLTSDPEKVMLKQLQQTNRYLTELAALNAHYPSIRKQAIKQLDKESVSVLQRIIDKNTHPELTELAQQHLKLINS